MRVETARSLAVTAARIRALGGPDLSHQFEIPPQPWYLRLTLWKAICYCGIITNFVLLITVPFRYH